MGDAASQTRDQGSAISPQTNRSYNPDPLGSPVSHGYEMEMMTSPMGPS